MEKKFNFVYITTNLINGKQYVGDHSTDNLNDRYLGSGRCTLLEAFKKYEKKNFKRKILEFFPTKKEAFDAQEKYIVEYDTLSPNGYNISPTGGNGISGCHSKETLEKISNTLKNHIVSDESKEKNRKAHIGKKHSQKACEKMSNSHKGKKLTEETKQKISKANKLSLKGKKLTEETKQKISESNKGRIISEETRKKISEKEKGKFVSSEIRTKISIANKGKKLTEETKQKISKAKKGKICRNKL